MPRHAASRIASFEACRRFRTIPSGPARAAGPRSTELEPGTSVDLALLGVPAWRTSLSPTNAHATPAAIRAALERYSPALMPDRRPAVDRGIGAEASGPVDLAALRFADLGDIDEPDGAEGEARTMAAVSSALDRASARWSPSAATTR